MAPVPTNTLANERTFLAYLRTALSFIAFGFVIARFALFAREMSIVAHIDMPSRHSSTLFGTVMALGGVIVGVYGTWRYIVEDRALREGTDRPMPAYAAVAGGIVIAIIGAIVALDLFAYQG